MRRFKGLLVPVFVLFMIQVWGQPLNDDCLTPTNISSGQLDNVSMMCQSITDDNTDATPWEISPGVFFSGTCWGGSIDSVVFFQFTAQGVSVDIDVTNGPSTPHISLIEFTAGACDGTMAVELGCTVGNNISIDNGLTVGTTYYIVLGFETQAEGTYDICVYNPMNPTNDECDMAIPIANLDDDACDANIDNYYPSTSSNFFPGCWGQTLSEVWFSFVAQGVSIADLHVENFTGTGNAYIGVLSGDCANIGAMVVLGCGANGDAILTDNNLIVGNTYYVVVAFENYASGTFDLCLDNPVNAFNDDCNDAPVIPPMDLADEFTCMTMIGADMITNDYPSTDIGLLPCWGNNMSYNVWYQFVAQGHDVDIAVEAIGFTGDEQIALIQFDQNDICNPAASQVLECEVGDTLSVDNNLVIGYTYYIVVGFQDNLYGDYCINVFNPVPPPNDTACAAIQLFTDGSCNSAQTPCPPLADCFTTQYANPEYPNNFFPADCQAGMQNNVFYTIQLDDAENVGFEIDLDPITAENLNMMLLQFDDCEQQFDILWTWCGDTEYPVEWGPADPDEVYYLIVGTSEEDEGSFSLCVDEIPPCFENNYCEDMTGGASSAEDIGTIITFDPDQGCAGGGTNEFTCIDGCNLFADPEPDLTPCLGQNDPVVWYQFTTDAQAALLNMTITSPDVASMSVQLWSTTDATCNTLQIEGLTEDNFTCLTGSQGVLVANSTPVNVNTTYFLAIGGVNTFGGEFQLCMATLTTTAGCVTESSLDVTARSFGGPLEGPYFPGEVVSVCLNVDNFQVSGANNCQWFQGIVPVFGAGWDPSSFDGDGQPLNATMNGNTFPANNIHNSGVFEWWTTASYHHPHCFYNIGDFDGNGTLDMCNSQYDPDCMGPGLEGSGGNGACWYDQDPGSILPGGWFTSGVNGSCGASIGYPGVDWGDGNTCNGSTGPWSFCFDLTIRTDCNVDENASDLTIGFISFADGEVGSWDGSASICGQDEPLFQQLPLCCNDLVNVDEVHDPICSGGVFSWFLDGSDIDENVDFWEWTVDQPSTVAGGNSGSGPNGTPVIDNLTNSGTFPEIVTYNFLGFAGGECPAIILTVEVEVQPEIIIEMDPFLMCATPTNAYEIVPIVTGGSGTYTYEWNDNNGSTTPTLQLGSPVNGQNITLIVTDDVGCTNSASISLDVYETFEVDIIPSGTEQCPEDGDVNLSVTASGGTGVFDTYEWELPNMGSAMGQPLDANESGEYLVIVTDDQGCTGRDSVQLNFYISPEVDLVVEDPFVCPGQVTQIFSTITNNGSDLSPPPHTYEWNDGTSTSFYPAEEPGTYSVIVTDGNGCTTEASISVSAAPIPQVDIGGDQAICLGEGLPELSVEGQGPFVQIVWSTGQIGAETIEVSQIGNYTVTVINDEGCRNTAEANITFFDQPILDLPDTLTYCQGQGVFFDAFDPEWVQYDWQHVSGSDDLSEQFFGNPDIYTLIVTDANGCEAEDDIVVLEAQFLTPTIDGSRNICPGDTAVLTIQEYFSMEWTDQDGTVISTTEELRTDTAGVFNLNVIDDFGCPGIASVEVTVSDPAVAITGPAEICAEAIAQLDAGPGYVSYDWGGGVTSQTIQVDTGGTYMVTVTTTDGCIVSDTLDVAEVELVPIVTGDTSICSNGLSIMNAGANYVSYAWSTGNPEDTLQMLAVNAPGIYTVTVTNALGCVGIDDFEVVGLPDPAPAVTGDSDFCVGGQALIGVSDVFESYLWSTGNPADTVQNISVNQAGTYIVTVTDVNGCVGTGQMVVNEPYQETNDILGVLSFCVGANTVLDAGTGYVSYDWSTGSDEQTITVTDGGEYMVTVVDADGCIAMDTVIVEEPYQETAQIQGSLSFCTGSNTILDAGPNYASYAWSDGSDQQTLNVTTGGQYSVIVVDNGGCIAFDTVVVTEANELSPQITGDTAFCRGDQVVLDVGNSFAMVSWSTTETSSSITVSTGGTYMVTVTDAGGCTGTDVFQLDENVEPFATVTPMAQSCNNPTDGSVINFADLVTAGDTGGDWVDLNGSGVDLTDLTNVDFDGIAPNLYQFQYTTNSAVPPCVDQVYLVNVTILDCNCANVQVDPAGDLCNSGGTLDLNTLMQSNTVLGGSWSLSNGPGGNNPVTLNGSTVDVGGADPGQYVFRYQVDGIPQGCPDTSFTTLTVNEPPRPGLFVGPAMVCVGADTVINLALLIDGADAGGTWSESSVIPSVGGAFSVASATFRTTTQLNGMYTFDYTVPGEGACGPEFTTVEVMIEELPVADAGTAPELTCTVESITLSGENSSQGDQFVYSWSTLDGGTIQNAGTVSPTITAPGTYTIEVLNSLTGCISRDDIVVTANGEFPTDVVFELDTPLCSGEGAASIDILSVEGGTAPFTYFVNGTEVTGTAMENIAPGDYTLLVEDREGCRYETSFFVPTPNIMTLDIEGNFVIEGVADLEEGDTLKLSYAFTGLNNIRPDSIVWKTETDPEFCINCETVTLVPDDASGLIFLEAYDENGCLIEAQILYRVAFKREFYIPNVFSPNGDDVNEYFTVFVNEPNATVVKMEIFSRWGDLVYSNENFPSNVPQLGWNGRFGGNAAQQGADATGDDLLPGVYVYHIHLRYASDNLEEHVKGDITLLR